MLSIHPFEPYIPEGAIALIIGTMPPYRFCQKVPQKNDPPEVYIPPILENGKVDEKGDIYFYYGSRDNSFWELLSEVTHRTLDTEKRCKDFLKEFNIGILDILESCRHKDEKSDDNSLEDREYQPLSKLLIKYPNINTLIYTSKKAGIWTREKHNTKYNKDLRKDQIFINGKVYEEIYLYSPSSLALKGLSKGGIDGKEKRLKQYTEVFEKLMKKGEASK